MNRTYELLTKYRFSLYGIALVWIFFRHTFFYNQFSYGLIDPIIQIGDCGVDIFMFLSGFGLYFSFSKNPSISQFYKKRVIRILPTVIILLALFAIYVDLVKESDSLTLIKPWYWFNSIYSVYWFIGAILLFYLCFPLVYKALNSLDFWKVILVAYGISIIGLGVVHFSHIGLLAQLKVYFARVPIFVLGAVFAKQQHIFDRKKTIALLFVCSIPLLYIMPKDLQRMSYVFLSVAFVSYIPNLLDRFPSWVSNSISYVGKSSLEFYMIHIFLFSNGLLTILLSRTNSQGITLIIALCLTILCSIATNYLFTKLTNICKR